MTSILMTGDIVTVDLRVRYAANPGDMVTLSPPDDEYAASVQLPFEQCAMRIPFLKKDDVVSVIGPEHHLVTVITTDGDAAWVKEDDGRRVTYQCGDLERLPPKRPKQETPPATPSVQEPHTDIAEGHF